MTSTEPAAAPGAADDQQDASDQPVDRRRRPRWQRVLIVLGILLVVFAGALYGGYRYLLTTEYGTFFTLFADDHRVENYRSMDELFPSESIAASADVWLFEREDRPLPETYTFDGEERRVDEFLERTETTGLLVARYDTILYEDYFLGNDAQSRATSWSVSKSVVSALVGIAIEEGHLGSVDDAVISYVPELAGSGYQDTTVRDLLTMSSGVDFDENYDATFADVNMIFLRAFAFREPMLDYYARLESIREPGTFNAYASSDTGVLAVVLARATGESVSSYAQSRLWEPAGMEGDASWSTDRAGAEIGFCCLNAQLRDYARFGRLYLNDGARDGRQIVPQEWVERSVTPEAPHLQPGDNPNSDWTFGYGYQWWIPEDPRPGEFTAIGVWGQYIYVDATRGMVIVKSSTDYWFDENDHETIEVFRAMVDEMAS